MECDNCGRSLESNDIYKDNPGFAYFYFCGYCDEDLDNQDLAERIYES